MCLVSVCSPLKPNLKVIPVCCWLISRQGSCPLLVVRVELSSLSFVNTAGGRNWLLRAQKVRLNVVAILGMALTNNVFTKP